ncbi:MAG: hypothetical protein Q7U91_10560 [Sideroxyarcus sp.]|nr:hypothetical protein [Sideroxyarcus sp.]
MFAEEERIAVLLIIKSKIDLNAHFAGACRSAMYSIPQLDKPTGCLLILAR